MADAKKSVEIHVTGKDDTAGMFNGLTRNLGGLKTQALELAAVFAGGLGIKSVIDATNEWGEGIHNLQKDLGVTAESASKLQYAARSVGMEADNITKAFGFLSRKMVETASDPAKYASSAFAQLGIKIRDDATGALKTFDEILPQVQEKLGRMENGTAKTGFEMALFSRSGRDMNEFLSMSPAKMKALGDEAERLGLVFSEAGEEKLYQFQLATYQLGLHFDALKVKLGVALVPTLTSLIDTVNTFISDTLPKWLANLRPIGDAFSILWQGALHLFDGLQRLAHVLVETTGDTRTTNTMMKALGDVARILAGGLKVLGDAAGHLAKLFQDNKNTVQTLQDAFLIFMGIIAAEKILAIVGAFQKLGPALDAAAPFLMVVQFSLFVAQVKELLDKLGNVQDKITLLEGLVVPILIGFAIAAGGVVAPIAAIGVALGLIVDFLIQKFGPQIGQAFSNFGTWAHNTWDGMVRSWELAKANLITSWELFKNDMGQKFSALGTMAHGLFDAAGNGIKSLWNEAVEFVKQKIYELTVKLDQIILKINQITHLNLPTLPGGAPQDTGQKGGPQDGDQRPPGQGGPQGGDTDSSTSSPRATLDDIYAAYANVTGGQTISYDYASKILAGGFSYAQVAGGAAFTGAVTGAFGGQSSGGHDMAEGGIVRRRPGGIMARIGEGSYDEAVIPLRPGAGMGSVVINVDVHDNVADSEYALAERVAQRVLQKVVYQVRPAF